MALKKTAQKATTAKIKEARAMAAYRQKDVNQLQTGRQGDISQGKKGGIYVASQTSRNKAFNSLTSSSKTAGRAKNVESKLKKAAAVKKAASPMKTSARSHQADLARMSGDTAGNKKFRDDKKAGKMYREDKPSPAYLAGKKAERRTLKSFK